MAEFTVPDFIQRQSPEEIHTEMIEQLPYDIDMSEGGHPYTLTFPTAYQLSRLIQFRLTEMIKMITPQHCQGYDEMAEEHGKTRGLNRKEAVSAKGKIEVTAKEGTIIPQGSIFSTASINGLNAIEFKTTDEEITYDEEALKSINVEAVIPGKDGNVQAGTIIVKSSDITGITAITNSTPTTGGMEEETLDDFIARIVEFDHNQGSSFIGNLADYKRWAEDTDKVGHANVKAPTIDDGLITIIITNLNGDPADEDICADVYNKIMDPTPLSTDGKATNGEVTGLKRLSPINAFIQVIPPTIDYITLSVSLKIDNELTNLTTLKSDIETAIKKYLTGMTEYVYISSIGSIIQGITGVIYYDMDKLLINEQSENIVVDADKQYSIKAENISITLL